MGGTQSHNLSPPRAENSSENMLALNAIENESDDDFSDCTDKFEELSADVIDDDESPRNSKPLESSSKADDDVARSQAKHLLGRKQTESDDDDDEDESLDQRKERQRKEMDEFREEMNKKREMRQQCVKKLREELSDLREKLSSEMETNEQLRDAMESKGGEKSFEDLADENKKLKIELAECQLFLQTSNSENINSSFENKALRDQVRSLKEVIIAVKEMLKIRECQVDQMKSKLTEIETSFAERETKIMSSALQQEYHRQLENIRNMRDLYEERASILVQEREALKQQLEEKEHDLKTEVEKSKNLDEYISTLENNVKLKNSDIGHLESEIGMLKSEKSQVASEMSAVNQLIAQVLFGFNANGSHLDIDKLVSMLEQNRDLLNEMAIKEDYEGIDEGSFLPKLLYDLFLQVNQGPSQEVQVPGNESAVKAAVCTPEEIAEKLPKVWRVLIELLSHHKKLSEEEENRVIDCYKSVQTATGTQNVLSVSKTFIKLKDLILEKRSLQKDTTRLKTLYTHLEQRLDKQEKRLSNVSLELTKTWHLVGKIKRQNRQLHTHEQILCYQLQQKRRVLNELKSELEYCRKKWALARALNSESEEQCKQLRNEFVMRKIQDQNSAESGYSDEHPSDADGDDDEAGTSKKADKVPKFDENLTQFERTSSPVNSERRRSESPLIRDYTSLSMFSRAQSEPPRIPSPINETNDELDNVIQDEAFEVLEMIPDPVQERFVGTPTIEPCSRSDGLVITPQPEIRVFTPQPSSQKASLSIHLHKHKKDKKRKTSGNSESAEDMFLRLRSLTKTESQDCSTCSSTTSYEDDDFDAENVEEIEDIPMDEATTSVVVEESELVLQPEVEEIVVQEVVESTPEVVKDDESMLSIKEQEYLQRKEARLARLEAEAQAFYDKMAKNKDKGIQLNNHINEMHQTFLDRNREKKKSDDEKTMNDEPSTSTEQPNADKKPSTEKKLDETESDDEN